jgi:putative transposase
MTQSYNELLHRINQIQTVDFFKEILATALHKIMDLDVSNQVKAGISERIDTREAYRNGYRKRDLKTRVGHIDLMIPKLRKGTYFPPFLQHYQRTESAMLSVVQQSYIQGVSTRKMEKIVQKMGLVGMSKSQVSEICASITEEVDKFMNTPIEGEWPYIYLDASYIKVREDHKVVAKAVIVAIGVNTNGDRRILGMTIADNEAAVFWRYFLESMIERGLKGVKLVISDAHKGLKEAISSTFLGASWQRCWVHFMRNVLCHTTRKNGPEIIALMKSIKAYKYPEGRINRWREVATLMEDKNPKIANLMNYAEEDVLAHTSFPEKHWTKIYTNNPIERLNREIKRRVKCVGIFPNDDAALRLVGAILIECNDKWSESKNYINKGTMKLLMDNVS